MKVALVSEHASPLALLGGVDAGGQNVHVAELARGLAGLGCEVVVHTRRDDPSLPRRVPFAPGVVVEHVEAGPAAPLPKDELLPHMDEFAADLVRSWFEDPPDVVHSHFWMSGIAALAAARPLGIAVAHTFHALGVVKRRQQGVNDTSPPERVALEASVARGADLVIATSFEERCELVAMGASPARVCVVPCGVDVRHFNPDGRAARRRATYRRIVVVSRLVERKGIGNVIEALPMIPCAELLIAGGPPQALLDHDAEAQRFRSLASRVRVDDGVELRGAVERADVPALMRSADVVACCPWYEPFGLVAVEAMACGIPVVASAVGGLAETVVDGVCGVHVPPRRPDRIAEAIQGLLSDESGRRAMGQRAVLRARRYDWPRVALETRNHLDRLAAGVVARRTA
jgi:D-inositol-3-phosphate glycosyltransferase